ncbi:MAG TPA: type II toxin-antitoxin system RelE/ParE family toxin [Edaphobacter sp.]|nr:type II toxin-antitoxin system RelE/ParE family toxin [Edaphobacter sp.]
MTYRVDITARAAHDLDNIYRYVEAEQSKQAATWFNGLYEALQSLTSSPRRSPLIKGGSQLRHLLYGNKPHIYRIIYSVDDSRKIVTILTIRHGARKAFS